MPDTVLASGVFMVKKTVSAPTLWVIQSKGVEGKTDDKTSNNNNAH